MVNIAQIYLYKCAESSNCWIGGMMRWLSWLVLSYHF